ncbi:MAG: hypothetical protein AAFS07_01180 [Pseudomonadota bacterium]
MFDTQSEKTSPTTKDVREATAIDPKHAEAVRWLDDRRATRSALPPARRPAVVHS